MSCHVLSHPVTSCCVTSRHVMPRLVTSCHVMSRHTTSCHAMSRHVTSCHVMLIHAMSSHVKSCHVMSRCVTSCHVTSCHVVSRRVLSSHVGCPEGCRFHTASAVYISAPVRSNAVADYVLPLFIFFIFFYSPFVLRNYSTDSHKISRDCVIWCSLSNPLLLKFFWRHLAEKIAKNSESFVKISWVD